MSLVSAAGAQPLVGIVRSSGRPVPGAQVTVRHGGVPFTCATDAAGRFEFADLAPGAVDLEVSMFGFDTLKRSVADRSQPLDLNLSLRAAIAQGARQQGAVTAEENGAEPTAETSDSLLVQGSVSRDLDRPTDYMPFMPDANGPGGAMGAPGFGGNTGAGQFPGAATPASPQAATPAPGGGGLGGGPGEGVRAVEDLAGADAAAWLEEDSAVRADAQAWDQEVPGPT